MRITKYFIIILMTLYCMPVFRVSANEPKGEEKPDVIYNDLLDRTKTQGQREESAKKLVHLKEVRLLKNVLGIKGMDLLNDMDLIIAVISAINNNKPKDYILLLPDIISVLKSTDVSIDGGEQIVVMMVLRREAYRAIIKMTGMELPIDWRPQNGNRLADFDDLKILKEVIKKTEKWWEENKDRILKEEAGKEKAEKKAEDNTAINKNKTKDGAFANNSSIGIVNSWFQANDERAVETAAIILDNPNPVLWDLFFSKSAQYLSDVGILEFFENQSDFLTKENIYSLLNYSGEFEEDIWFLSLLYSAAKQKMSFPLQEIIAWENEGKPMIIDLYAYVPKKDRKAAFDRVKGIMDTYYLSDGKKKKWRGYGCHDYSLFYAGFETLWNLNNKEAFHIIEKVFENKNTPPQYKLYLAKIAANSIGNKKYIDYIIDAARSNDNSISSYAFYCLSDKKLRKHIKINEKDGEELKLYAASAGNYNIDDLLDEFRAILSRDAANEEIWGLMEVASSLGNNELKDKVVLFARNVYKSPEGNDCFQGYVDCLAANPRTKDIIELKQLYSRTKNLHAIKAIAEFFAVKKASAEDMNYLIDVFLNSWDLNSRNKILKAILYNAQFHDLKIVAPLANSNKSYDVITAIRCAAKIGGKKSMNFILGCVEDKNYSIKRAAIISLWNFANKRKVRERFFQMDAQGECGVEIILGRCIAEKLMKRRIH